ncbi:MAG: ZPR1 zinc finger domain-containing protein [Vulcanisaeta sp.]|jgi:zinc finger protein|nr:ZPR1 zinc finger domain-containing protein [Vulcanisaeta sp.]MCG2892435.1 ZPR1 zinc finger domain-containing protein [Vulcanisaeta sp.]
MSEEGDVEVRGRVIYTGVERCPVCGRDTLQVTETLYSDPVFGELILYSNYCSSCGYRRTDIQYLDSRGPTRIAYEVRDAEDVYRTYIFRSRGASLRSPELGFEIDPGPEAEAMITTMEGLLYRLLDVADRMEVLNEGNETVLARLREFKRKVKEALEGRFRFTIIIEDPTGNSTLKPPRGREGYVRVEPL